MAAEKMFIRFSEINENEGESWSWWLQLDGNALDLSKLADLLATADQDEDEPSFTLHGDDIEPEAVVDKLVQYAADGYYAAHNKVVGRFVCPDTLGEYAGKLYKGGIKDFFSIPKKG